MTEPTPQSSTFDLLDAALNGQSQRLVSLYHDHRQQKVEPLVILGLLGWQLHILALIKTAGQRSAPEIAQQAGVNPFVVQKSQAIARRVAFSTIKSWVERATQLDVKLKSQPIDADQALLHFLLTIS
jgi:DNA polymerase III delta subunit